MFAHHKEEDEVYPFTTIEIADAQRNDQELKVYRKNTHTNATKGHRSPSDSSFVGESDISHL